MKKMNLNEMKLPKDLVKDEARQPISARVKTSTLRNMENEAKKLKIKTAALTAAILDDYSDWLEKRRD